MNILEYEQIEEQEAKEAQEEYEQWLDTLEREGCNEQRG